MKFRFPLACLLLIGALTASPTFAQDSVTPAAGAAPMDADSIAFMKAQLPAPSLLAPPEEVRDARRRARLRNQPDLPQVLQVKEYAATGPAGPIPIRLYLGAGTPATGALPVLVYYHGGGWLHGDLDSHDWICRSIANQADCAVISVDYRLAPEHRFPAAFDDALAALLWVVAQAASLRVDPARVSVGGDSAGGNLAAAVALALRDEGGTRLKSQILIYPAVDLSMSGDYYGRFTKNLILTDDAMRTFIGLYVPDVAQRKDWRASPLLASSLKGLPPTFILLAGFDPLRAEGEAYAARLAKEGVPTTVQRYPGQMHGFLSNARLLPKANDAIADIATALKGSP
ncbi:MAG: alpha/beta hydrolase [Chthoniobacter sp.]|uniref:alpha/beta hydrolase n=1 Tax=Chthoniobacter sp. TaxID=2510640 RepID=UPI0032A90D5F